MDETRARPPEATAASGLRSGLGYAALLLLAVLGFLWIRALGSGLAAAPPPPGAPLYGGAESVRGVDTLLHVLLALALVIVTARGLGLLFRRLRQPPVIGEVIAGLMLGPSLLGRLAPEVSAYVLPPSVAPFLSVIAQVGVILYMFLVGLELDTAFLRRSPHAALAISHASIVFPFLLGAALALVLYPLFSTSDVPFTVFALFMGISMSVTAFPVLARILTDRRLQRTRLGQVAIACAAVDDVSAWCLLALVVSVARSRASDAVHTLVLSLLFVSLVVVVLRPLVGALVRSQEGRNEVSEGALGTVCVLLLLCAFATEWIGIHALFGAFLLGAVIPSESTLARDLTHRLRDLVVVLLLPAFFAFTGLRTQIALLSGLQAWLVCALVIAVASVGKFGGSALAARTVGLSWRDGAVVGILMNTRGLMELIVLNIGLDLGVLSPTLFAMLVLMAVVTTLATTPLVDRLSWGDAAGEAPGGAARAVG